MELRSEIRAPLVNSHTYRKFLSQCGFTLSEPEYV